MEKNIMKRIKNWLLHSWLIIMGFIMPGCEQEHTVYFENASDETVYIVYNINSFNLEEALSPGSNSNTIVHANDIFDKIVVRSGVSDGPDDRLCIYVFKLSTIDKYSCL